MKIRNWVNAEKKAQDQLGASKVDKFSVLKCIARDCLRRAEFLVPHSNNKNKAIPLCCDCIMDMQIASKDLEARRLRNIVRETQANFLTALQEGKKKRKNKPGRCTVARKGLAINWTGPTEIIGRNEHE